MLILCWFEQIGQSHPTGLTANLLKLFEPRPPLEYKPPPEKKKSLPYTGSYILTFCWMLMNFNAGWSWLLLLFEGMAQFVTHFASPDDPEYAPPVKKAETPVSPFLLLPFCFDVSYLIIPAFTLSHLGILLRYVVLLFLSIPLSLRQSADRYVYSSFVAVPCDGCVGHILR